MAQEDKTPDEQGGEFQASSLNIKLGPREQAEVLNDMIRAIDAIGSDPLLAVDSPYHVDIFPDKEQIGKTARIVSSVDTVVCDIRLSAVGENAYKLAADEALADIYFALYKIGEGQHLPPKAYGTWALNKNGSIETDFDHDSSYSGDPSQDEVLRNILAGFGIHPLQTWLQETNRGEIEPINGGDIDALQATLQSLAVGAHPLQ